MDLTKLNSYIPTLALYHIKAMLSCTRPINSLPIGACLTHFLMRPQEDPRILETINKTEQLTIYRYLNIPIYVKRYNIRLIYIDLKTTSSIKLGDQREKLLDPLN